MTRANIPILERTITLPRLFGALAAASSIFLATTLGANASQLVCRQYSAKDATQLLETIKISVAESGPVRVWHRQERTPYWNEREEDEKVLAHWVSTQPGTGSKFSVVVIKQRSVDKAHMIDEIYPPKIYFIDWGNAKLAEASVPFTLDPVAQIDTRWECNRLD
jgi:hypothetical protein